MVPESPAHPLLTHPPPSGAKTMAAAGAPWSWMVHALIAALILGATGNQDLSVCTQANRAGVGGEGWGAVRDFVIQGDPM